MLASRFDPNLVGVGDLTMNADHYRHYAKACLKLANVMKDIQSKTTMIEVAAGWMRLAEHAQRNGKAAYSYPEYKTKKAS